MELPRQAAFENCFSVLPKAQPECRHNSPLSSAAPTTAEQNCGHFSYGNPESRLSSTPNIVDLVGESEYIIRGFVKEVTDGFENGVPYTQVTIAGQRSPPRTGRRRVHFPPIRPDQTTKMGNGKVYLGVSPDGWSKYAVGENTMLFLYKRASMTGLQTTVGLGQGKVVFQGGNAVSQFGNTGLFENVDVERKTPERQRQKIARHKERRGQRRRFSLIRATCCERQMDRREENASCKEINSQFIIIALCWSCLRGHRGKRRRAAIYLERRAANSLPLGRHIAGQDLHRHRTI